jgi:RNA polymerase sigma-70 factor (ECF subfamily)
MASVDELYRLYRRDIYGYIYSLTRDSFLTEDLLQDTFLQAIKGINKFKGDSSVKTWLCSIARHIWLKHLRKHNNQPDNAVLSDIIDHNDIEENYINSEKAKLIADFISQKDEKTRQVTALRVEGYSFSEIAAKLKISEGSARVIFHRCKTSVISYVKEQRYDEH